MKYIVLLLALAAGFKYYLVDGGKIDEEAVEAFYKAQAHATYSRDPEAICKMLSNDATLTSGTGKGAQRVQTTQNTQEACQAYRDFWASVERMGEKAGGILTVEYNYHLEDLAISADKKTATVTEVSELKLGESFMHVHSKSSDELVRKYRQVKLKHANADFLMHMNANALNEPSQWSVQ